MTTEQCESRSGTAVGGGVVPPSGPAVLPGSTGLVRVRSVDAQTRVELASGVRVREFGGIPWQSARLRFWRPVDQLAPVTPTMLPPRWAGVGCMAVAATPGGEPPVAPATGPVLRLTVVDVRGGYPWTGLSKNRRSTVRRGLERNEFRVTNDPGLIADRAWAIVDETERRVGSRYGVAGTPEQYRAALEARCADGASVIVAGLVEGRVEGFTAFHVLGRMAYVDSIALTATAQRRRICDGLYWHTLAIAAASGLVDGVCLGPWFPENPTLASYKAAFGGHIVEYPAVGWMHAPVAAVLRRRSPGAYGRLTGRAAA